VPDVIIAAVNAQCCTISACYLTCSNSFQNMNICVFPLPYIILHVTVTSAHFYGSAALSKYK